MSYQSGNPLTLTLGATNITRGRFVRLVAGLVVPATAGADEAVIGVSTDDVVVGTNEALAVHMIDGTTIVEVEAGGAIALGDQVTAGAGGVAATAVAGNRVSGIALSATTAAGEFVTVLLTHLAAAT